MHTYSYTVHKILIYNVILRYVKLFAIKVILSNIIVIFCTQVYCKCHVYKVFIILMVKNLTYTKLYPN